MPPITTPAFLTYIISECQDVCRTFTDIRDIVATLNRFLTELNRWILSASFPNIRRDPITGVVTYFDGTAMQPYPSFPNVFVKGGKLLYSVGNTEQLVPPESIEGNVFWDATKTEPLRVARENGVSEAIYPYVGCVRYDPDMKLLQYHDGATWQVIPLRPIDGAVFIADGKIKKYVATTDSYLTVDLPPKRGDLRVFSGLLFAFNGTTWERFYQHNQLRVRADLKSMERYDQYTKTWIYAGKMP